MVRKAQIVQLYGNLLMVPQIYSYQTNYEDVKFLENKSNYYLNLTFAAQNNDQLNILITLQV